MKVSKTQSIGWLLLTLAASGCGQFGSAAGDAQGSSASPEEVVGQFLEAVRVGDDRLAAELLTPLARQKTAEMQIVVAPPGSETAQFKVQGVQMVSGGAQVTSDWTDLDADGQRHTDRILWNLRKVDSTWRVAGMETQVFADSEPVRLNFEDPAAMLSAQQLAEEEIARRQQEAQPEEEPARATR